jgi:hypothetical protein
VRYASGRLVSSNPADAGSGFAIPLAQVPVAIPSGTLTGSFSTPPLYIQHMEDVNFQVNSAGTAAGQLTVYQSNDPDQPYINGAVSPYMVTNWAEVCTLSISGLACAVVNLRDQAAKFLMVSWVQSAGTGSMDVTWSAKGPS